MPDMTVHVGSLIIPPDITGTSVPSITTSQVILQLSLILEIIAAASELLIVLDTAFPKAPVQGFKFM
jgi:hypothetical protein